MVRVGGIMVKSAMILAAGLGKRMRPLTDTLPKPLISVAGKSMLDRAFHYLQKTNVSNIVVNTHYLAPLIERHIKTFYPQTSISHEEILLETGGGVKKALPLLGQDPFFVLNGDSIWTGPKSLTSMEKKWNGKEMDSLLLLIPRSKAHGYKRQGDFHMGPDGHLWRPKNEETAPYVYIGVQLLNPQLFQDSPSGSFSMNLLWDQALRKRRLYGHVHEGEWFHISTPQDINKYEPMIESIL